MVQTLAQGGTRRRSRRLPAPAPATSEGGGGTSTPARPAAPALSEDKNMAELVTPGPAEKDESASPILAMETLDPEHAKVGTAA